MGILKYTYANKKKATQFTGFVKNKYRHDKFIYLESHILHDCNLY